MHDHAFSLFVLDKSSKSIFEFLFFPVLTGLFSQNSREGPMPGKKNQGGGGGLRRSLYNVHIKYLCCITEIFIALPIWLL